MLQILAAIIDTFDMSISTSVNVGGVRSSNRTKERKTWNAGLLSMDAVSILQRHGVIEQGSHQRVPDFYRYPTHVVGFRKCHLRALYNVSKSAAYNACEDGVKHNQNDKVKHELQTTRERIIEELGRITKQMTIVSATKGVKSVQYKKLTRELKQLVLSFPSGEVYRLKQEHWVSLTKTTYTDDAFFFNVIDHVKASKILSSLEDPKSDYYCVA